LSQLPYGLLIDAGTHVTVTGGTLQVGGVAATRTPALLFDARGAGWVDFPVFRRPGRPTPVQNAALVGGELQIIRPGDTLRLVTRVGEEESSLPASFRLDPNYPNPFNPATVVGYALPSASDVRLAVYDLLGREVAVLVDGPRGAGTHAVRFNAEGLASGVYVYRLMAGGYRLARTMTLIR
jgi:hypothetical protein